METITIQEAQSNLRQYLSRVATGETMVVTDQGNPIAEIRRYEQPVKPRVIGLAKGSFQIPDDFFEPLPVEVLERFTGKDS